MPPPASIPPPAHDAPLPPPLETSRGTRLLTGVPYAALPGIRPLEIDVWLPLRSEDPAPAVLFLHGGGWRAGSRHLAGPAFRGVLPSPFEQVARAGIAVASADYRLSGEATWPAQLHDVKAAVRWLRARAGELGIDGDRIAAWGESAGGPLARGRRGRHRPVEPGQRGRRLVRAERPCGDGRRHGHRPDGPGYPRGAAAGRAAAARPGRRRAGQPDHARLPRSPTVPVAARRGRSPRPVRAERTAAQRTPRDGTES